VKETYAQNVRQFSFTNFDVMNVVKSFVTAVKFKLLLTITTPMHELIFFAQNVTVSLTG
jgi:hypothetical protein